MKKSLIALAALACAAAAFAQPEPTQRAAFALYVAGDPTCEAQKPSKPMKPGKGPTKPGKKCIEANVPLDDGYVLAKGKGKAKTKAKKAKTT